MMFNKESLTKNGFARLELQKKHSNIVSLASSIGNVFDIPNMPLVQTLTPKSIQSTKKNTYSGNYGFEEFPLHTDLAHWYLPPRYFILRCIDPDPNVSTVFLTKKKALHNLSEFDLKRAIFKPRRNLENKMYFLRVIENNVFRWDEMFIIPVNEEAQKVANHIKSLKESDDLVHFYFDTPNQSILVDNWAVLHGRSKVNQANSKRKIERIYLKELSN